MNSTSQISVIIPTYNRSQLLQEAIVSILNQTVSPQEIIIVDDGSKEDILSVIENIRKNYLLPPSFIKMLTIQHCGMPGAVRNVGIQHAQGIYIAFLDSDDIWLPHKIELQLPLMEKYRIAHTRERWIRDGVEVSQKKQKHKRQGDVFEDALQKCILGPSTTMLHKSLFETYGFFREDIRIAEDYELWLRITAHELVGYTDTPLTVKYCRTNIHQLSTEILHIENFRIDALQPLVEQKIFPPTKIPLAEKVLRSKLDIWNKGKKKRTNI